MREGWLLLSTLVQVPILIWLFGAIRSNSALANASFAWLPSLAHADPFFILPVVAVVASVGSVLLQRRSKSESSSVLWLQPALSFVFTFALPAGVAIYMISAQVTQMALQLGFQRGA